MSTPPSRRVSFGRLRAVLDKAAFPALLAVAAYLRLAHLDYAQFRMDDVSGGQRLPVAAKEALLGDNVTLTEIALPAGTG